MSGVTQVPVLLAAAAGGLSALAAREAVLATPALARWVGEAVNPLRRAGSEGYAPTGLERRRLAVLGTVATAISGTLLLGPGIAPLLAPAGPALAAAALARRRARYRRAVERGVPEIATALADAVAAGRSAHGALIGAAAATEGPPGVELARVRAELELGASTAEALGAMRRRLRSPRIDSLAVALVSQQVGGGDLAGLLRRLGASAAERERVAADARSATAQARFTGLLVVAMPTGAALFAELLEPGFAAGLVSDPGAAWALAAAAGLQLAGFLAIRRLSSVGEG